MTDRASSVSPTIVWFQQDLRLSNNGALHAAIARGGPILPLFIWAPDQETPWAPGGASRWWLHQSLRALDEDLRRLGSRLLFASGPSEKTLRRLLAQTQAGAVFWNRRYEPAIRNRQQQLKASLSAEGYEVKSFPGAVLFEPEHIRNKQGRPFQVFTPFWKHCLSLPQPAPPLPRPKSIPVPAHWPTSESLDDFGLQPTPDWAGGLRQAWKPGERTALAQMKQFIAESFTTYGTLRNRPDLPGTSALSPYLHFGELTPGQIWHQFARENPAGWHSSQFLSEIGWREFSHHLLYHFPETHTKPLRPEFEKFPWRENRAWLRAWQKGRTGYPLVDAGMRQLWATGWMHNRVRMVVASFLVKDLLIPWQEGARWFWDTLVDADLAQNTLGWQWTAGCGADAAPFFRIFNPASQGEKFDPQGNYIRRWVPELERLPASSIHEPHKASPEVLEKAGVILGETYPAPIVSHTIAREVALEAYAALKPARRT